MDSVNAGNSCNVFNTVSNSFYQTEENKKSPDTSLKMAQAYQDDLTWFEAQEATKNTHYCKLPKGIYDLNQEDQENVITEVHGCLYQARTGEYCYDNVLKKLHEYLSMPVVLLQIVAQFMTPERSKDNAIGLVSLKCKCPLPLCPYSYVGEVFEEIDTSRPFKDDLPHTIQILVAYAYSQNPVALETHRMETLRCVEHIRISGCKLNLSYNDTKKRKRTTERIPCTMFARLFFFRDASYKKANEQVEPHTPEYVESWLI